MSAEQEKDPKQLESGQPKPSSVATLVHPLASLSQARKNVLLLIFSISIFVDVCSIGGVAVAVADIASDLKLGASQVAWILTAYSITFSAFLLFAGRLADLFPAQIVFESGFFLLGVWNLVMSFVTHSKYGFLVLRGLAGVSGSMTIPSSYHLIVHMYSDSKEREGKLGLLGLAGATGNIIGLVIAGICMLANWTWFFRVLAIICIGFSIISFILLPKSMPSDNTDPGSRWKRMDASALLCFILGLTQGPIDGWGSASFIAPFIIALVLGPAFFLWEYKIPSHTAVLPASVWKITNMVTSSLIVLIPVGFWIPSQVLYSTFWQEELRWKPRVIAFFIGGMTQKVPGIINKPRISVPIGITMIMIAQVLQYYSDGGRGMDYWKWCFPAFLLGSAGAITCYFGSAINIIQHCPPEMAGVASAWTNVVAQIGGAINLAVQAGLSSPDVSVWRTSGARVCWFTFALAAVLVAQFLYFYKEPASPEEEHELARGRMKAAGLLEK
ncbi:hypothetical protein RQP46_001073 [Phenoliferia psychrophenolica]